MAQCDERQSMASLERLSTRHRIRVADARHSLAARRSELAAYAAALEETLDDLRHPYQRYRISRRLEVLYLVGLGTGESFVADSVIQALGLSDAATFLVALAAGGAAIGLSWLLGHEWALSRDPQAVASGRRGWLRVAGVTSAAFLVINLSVRVYYYVCLEKAGHAGILAPLLFGSLLTAVTAALMVVAAFVTAHAETAKESELRAQLRRVRSELRSHERRVGTRQHASRARLGTFQLFGRGDPARSVPRPVRPGQDDSP